MTAAKQQNSAPVAGAVSSSRLDSVATVAALCFENNARRYSDEVRPLSQLFSLALESEINPAKWRELLAVANDRLDAFAAVVSVMDVHEKSPNLWAVVGCFVDEVSLFLGALSSICDESEKRGGISLGDRAALIPEYQEHPFLSVVRLILSGDYSQIGARFACLLPPLNSEIADLHDFSWLTVCASHESGRAANTLAAYQFITDSTVFCNGLRLVLTRLGRMARVQNDRGV